MCVAVVDFQRSGYHAFLPQGNHQHRVDFRGTISLIIVFNDDFSTAYRFECGWANYIVLIAIVIFPYANIRQHVVSIGDRHRIGVDIVANDIAHLAQRFAIHMTEQRQRFVGDIERQFGLPRGAGLFFSFDALHQQHDKADTDAAKDHRNADFRDDIDTQGGGWRPDNHQNHGQRFTQHPGQNTNAPVLRFRDFDVDPARKQPGNNTGDETRHGSNATNINQIAVHPGN